MSDNMGDNALGTETVDVNEVVDDVLDDIERVLSQPPPPVEDHLGALAAQLVEEREVERRSVRAALPSSIGAELDDVWASEEEATTEWKRPPTVPPAAESLQVLLRFLEETRELGRRESIAPELDETPRPAAVCISTPPEAPARRRLPLPLALVALISVAAAFVSYRLGPHSHATAPPAPVAAAAAPEHTPLEAAALDSTLDFGAPLRTERLLVTVSPPDAHLAIRAMDEPQGERFAGPWPRAFDLAPGVYELVAFRDGRSVVSGLEIEPGVAPPPLALRVPTTD